MRAKKIEADQLLSALERVRLERESLAAGISAIEAAHSFKSNKSNRVKNER